MSAVNDDLEVAESDTPVCAVGELSASDPAIHEQIIRPWALLTTPIKRGNFGFRMRYLKTPAITLYHSQFDLGCRMRGLSPPDIFTFSVPLRMGSHSSYWNVPWCRSGIPAMLPGGLDMTISAGHMHLVVLVKLSFMRSHLPAELVNSLSQAAGDHLLPAMSVEIEHLGRWLYALIDETNRQPQLLQHPAVVRSMEEDLIYRLANVVHLPPVHATGNNSPGRHTGLDRALEHLRAADLSSLTIPQLSGAAGVSLRSLEYAFRKTFQLTPIGFIRLQRFHAARQKLTAASPRQTTVAHVACNNGFYHLGRFSADYRRLFGELPSKTLLQQYSYTGKEMSPLLA
jgi:AraC-like DNA-binding protein